ncbi:MAG: VWA domain-containing protein [Bryobacterales bacterium]|nr:VWA domain-containing protein [Bryobacterales bacterium]
MTDPIQQARWRLILGSDCQLGGTGLTGAQARMDQSLGFLYDRELAGRNSLSGDAAGGRQGGLDPSALTVPDWINHIHELFPKQAIERLEKDALERYQLDDIVTNPEVLQRAEPSQTLLEAVLRTKHLMNQEVLAAARILVKRVVEEILRKLAFPIRQPFFGPRLRERSLMKIAKNFDWRETIRKNLKNYDAGRRQIVIHEPRFFSRQRRQMKKWKVIIVVDQSGSMASSVIYSAVTASIFHGIPSLQTHLIAFDTAIVDLTSDCADPVELLMKVQLGGGTDIGGALSYAAGLIDNPRQTIVVLITDFFEGAPTHKLFSVCRHIIESGAHLLGLAALNERAVPEYDRNTAAYIAKLGAHVGAMTPGELANWVAEKVGR